MGDLEKNGETIHYEQWAETGEPVLLLGGHTRAITDLRMLGKKLAEAGFLPIAIDYRGGGKSTSNVAFTLDDLAQDVVDVLNLLGVNQCGALGISMGGMLVQYLSRNYPTLFSKIFLVSTTSNFQNLGADDSEWPNDLDGIVEKLKQYFAEDFIAKNGPLIKAMAKNTHKLMVEGKFAERAAKQRQAMAEFNESSVFEGCKLPVYILHGQDDRIIGPSNARTINGLYQGSKLEVVEGIGHLFIAEAPNLLYQRAIQFFGT